MYEELYAQNKGLLISMARRYAGPCAMDRAISEEDLTQAGFLALVQAAQTYDPACGKSWVGWAMWHIRREYDRMLGLRDGRFIHAHSGADTLDRPLSDADGEGATPLELLADDSLPPLDAGLLLAELRRGVREAVDRLEDPEQRRVIKLFHLEERSCRNTAALMGVDERQVRQISERARRWLARDWRLQRLADLDDLTRFHAHKGVAAFNRDWTSVTEGAALWRIEQRKAAATDNTGSRFDARPHP